MKRSIVGRPAGILAAALAVFAATGSSAQTLSDTLVDAYQFNPSLRITRAELRQLDENVTQAQSDRLPDITGVIGGQVTGEFDRQGTTTGPEENSRFDGAASVEGEVPLYTWGRTEAQIDSAVATVMSARARLVNVEQEVLLDAVTAYMDVRRDLRFVDIARNNVRVINEQLRATRDRFSVGEVTRTDVSQAEAALAQARANLANSTGLLEQSRASYRAAVGKDPVELSPPPPVPALPASQAEAEEVAMRSHPLLTAARRAEMAAEYDVDLAEAGLNPLISLTGSVYYEHGQLVFRDFSNNADTLGAEVGIQLQIPLYRGGELDSIVRQARDVVAQRKAETQDTARVLRQSVRDAWTSLRVARASISANREQIQAAQVAFDGVVEEAKYGERTTLDVLDAEQTLLEARSDLVEAQRDEYVSAYTLLSTMGLLTVEHLGLTVAQYDPAENYDYVSTNPANPDGLRLERILDRWE